MADISLPSTSLVTCQFRLSFAVSSATIGGGIKVNVTENAPPVWTAEIATKQFLFNNSALGEWTAFVASLRGGINPFLAYDATKSRPYAYPNANAVTDVDAGWDGTADVSALTAAGSLSLTGLPAGHVISKGDRIGLEQTVASVARYGYHEVTTGATADGSGAATVTVTPHIKTGIFTTSATARLWRPLCRFVADPEYNLDQAITYGSVAFTGAQRV